MIAMTMFVVLAKGRDTKAVVIGTVTDAVVATVVTVPPLITGSVVSDEQT